MTTSTETKLRRGTSAQIASMTPAEGEVVYNTTTKTLHAGDGSTAGGNPMATKGYVDSAIAGFISPNVSQNVVSAPTGTSNTTGVMMGLNASLTPAGSGVVLVTVCGTINNTVSACGGKYQIRHGTGSAPSNADALTGTPVGTQPAPVLFPTPNYETPFSVTSIVTGLSIGTPYWFDMDLAALNGGTTKISNVAITAVEIH